MQCVESLRAQAYFDHELDSPGAAEIEGHARHCGRCCRSLKDLEHVRTALRRELTYMSIPPALEARMARALNQETAFGITPVHRRGSRAWRPRPFWQGAFTGIGGMAIAASIAYFVMARPLRSLQLFGFICRHADKTHDGSILFATHSQRTSMVTYDRELKRPSPWRV